MIIIFILIYLGDIKIADKALSRNEAEPPATESASRQEHARARMCRPASELPFSEMGSPARVERSSKSSNMLSKIWAGSSLK